MLRIGKVLLLWGMCGSAAIAYSGDIATLELRLETPLNSYKTAVGSTFRTVLMAPCLIGDRLLLPSGTHVYGTLKRRWPVGIGLVHERAGLDLEFTQYQLPDGRRFLLQGRLRSVDNARETVTPSGHLEGVLAADNPQRWFDGVWKKPSVLLFQHSLLGLTGMSGRIFEAAEMGPWGAVGLIALRTLLFSLPEPEIRLPIGTEMRVALTRLPEGVPFFPKVTSPPLPEDVLHWVGDQTFLTGKPDFRKSDDLINVAFWGTQKQLVAAFQAAGWTAAAPRGVRSYAHMWNSYASQTGDSDAPASKILYRGEQPDFVFQKSFNSVAMRHHVRIWQAEYAGEQIWLGAATHDVAIRFEASRMGFTHKIEGNIDVERNKLMNDLSFVGCTDGVGMVPRPLAVRFSSSSNGIVSDGKIAVASVRDCAAAESSSDPEMLKPARSIFVRAARRVILETRQYLVRENPYYWGYRLWQWKRATAVMPTSNEY